MNKHEEFLEQQLKSKEYELKYNQLKHLREEQDNELKMKNDDLKKTKEELSRLLKEMEQANNNDDNKDNKNQENNWSREIALYERLIKEKEEHVLKLEKDQERDRNQLKELQKTNLKLHENLEVKQNEFFDMLKIINKTIDSISSDIKLMRNHLESLTMINEESNGCPRLFSLTVIDKKWKYKPTQFLETKMKLQFLCAYDYSPAVCGPKGDGYVIKVSNDFAQKIGPAIKATAMILKLVSMAGTITTGFELPAPDMGNMIDERDQDKIKWDFIISSWPASTQDNNNEEDGEEIGGQAYRMINHEIRQKDPNLNELKMELIKAKDGLIKWVKPENVYNFENFNAITRGGVVGVSSKDEVNLHSDALEILPGKPQKNAFKNHITRQSFLNGRKI